MGSLHRSSLNLFLISLWSIHQLILTFQGLKAKKKKRRSPSSPSSLHSSLIPGFPPWSSQLLAALISVHTPTATALNDNECYSRHTACTRTSCTLLFFSSHFNSSTLRSVLIKEGTESLSVWSSHGDEVLCCLVLTRRACIIEGKRWIRMMSWLDSRLGGNAVREMRGSIKILRGVVMAVERQLNGLRQLAGTGATEESTALLS